MICVSIQNKEYQEILEILKTVEMAEIRLDRCALEDEEIEELFADSDVPLIATCRLSEESQAAQLLELAIRSGAKYADLEMEAPAASERPAGNTAPSLSVPTIIMKTPLPGRCSNP